MRFLRRSLVGLFLLSLTLGLFAIAGNTVYTAVQERMNAEERSFPRRERVLTVNVVPFEPGTIAPELTVFGEVRSRTTLDIRPSVSGQVVEISPNFEEGGRVSAGDVLLRLDPADAETALARVEADIRDAEAEVRDAERALALATDDWSAATEQLALREQALARQQDLQTRGVGTAAAVEAAELAVSSARQSVLSRSQSVAQSEGRLDSAHNALARLDINFAEAERRLSETVVYAAFDGTLSGVSVVPGGRVSQNEQLGTLIDPRALEVAFRVSTSQYARLLDDDGALILAPASIRLDVQGIELTSTGQITRESAAVGEGQTGRLLFARIEDARGLRPGDFVTVGVTEPELPFVALLPSTALGSDNTVLAIGEEDRLQTVSVELLRRQGDDVIVRSGELPGRDVVAERTPLLGAGIKVNPLRPGAGEMAETPAMVELTDERRAALVEFVENNPFIPAEAKQRVIAQLQSDSVPAQVVERLESRMGG